jgi:ABC-type branched-subunit amino acid transport system ATPase component
VTPLVYESVASGPLRSVNGAFERGLHVVLGKDGAELDALIAVTAGEVAARRGRVLVGGADPHRVPGARRRVAALRAVEALPPGSSVAAALAVALAAREATARPDEVLARSGHVELGARSAASLRPAEARSLALSLSLSDTRAEVLALHEPFATSLTRSELLSELRVRAESAVVLVTTASLADARSLGGAWYVLDAGTLSLAPAAIRGARTCRLRVRSPQARRLAALLSGDPSVSAVTWNERRAPAELLVSTADPAAFGRTLAELTSAESIAVDALVPVAPPLEAALAERAGYLQGAYEGAYRQAYEQHRTAPPQAGSTVPTYTTYAHQYESPNAAPADQTVTIEMNPPEPRK